MPSIEEFLSTALNWYESNRDKNGHVNTNVMNAGLIVSEMVRDGLPIPDKRFFSAKGSQVRGLSGSSIARILDRNGEIRQFTSEGGRTSRRTLLLAYSYRKKINNLTPDAGLELSEVASQLESLFTKKVQSDYFDKQRLDVDLDHNKPVASIIGDILKTSANRSDKPTGTVLQHLVGAALQLRFPNEEIGVDKSNTADLQTDREGDFQLGDTAFHVTVSPMEKLIQRCISNKKSGFRPVILTVRSRIDAAYQMIDIADSSMSDRVLVSSSEDFIGLLVEEMSIFDGKSIRSNIARLIRLYNNRIDQIETDKSLMLKEPRWVVKLIDK